MMIVSTQKKNKIEIEIENKDILKELELVFKCLEEDIYEASVILSQAKFERIVKRIMKIKLKNENINPSDIDSFLNSNSIKLDTLVDKYFRIVFKEEKLSLSQFIKKNLKELEKINHFENLWRNFKETSKKIRNDLIHNAGKSSDSNLILSTKNNMYLIALIVEVFQNQNIDPLKSFKAGRPQKNSKSLEEYLGEKINSKQKGKTKLSFKKTEEQILNYEKFLRKQSP